MKKYLVVLAALTMAVSPALAGGGAPVPDRPQGGNPSGRPGEILDTAKCQDVWRSVAKSEVLTAEEAGPVVANFKMVDKDSNGTVTQQEFKDGCKTGMVQEHASKPADAGGGQTPENPENP